MHGRIIQVLKALDDVAEIGLRRLVLDPLVRWHRPLLVGVLIAAPLAAYIAQVPLKRAVQRPGAPQSAARPAAAPAPVPVPPPQPVHFEVESTDLARIVPVATIRGWGSQLVVRPGAVIPDPALAPPRLIITRIEEHGVQAWDCQARRMVRVESEEQVARVTKARKGFKISAIAGDKPNFVAVIEYKGETYIVQPGTSVPESGPKEELRIKAVGEWSVEAEGIGANKADDLDLDLEGI